MAAEIGVNVFLLAVGMLVFGYLMGRLDS